jgi:23S rRNA (pseudouridine1915-N3)-methyltransferase
MNKLIIRAIGKAQEDWHQEAIQGYLERLGPFAKVEIIELPEGHGGSAKPDLVQTRKKEAESLAKGLPADAWILALDDKGKQYDSVAFAKGLESWSEGGRTVVFLIGGSWGIDPELLARANQKLSLGSLTLPHLLARIVLLEQLYRAETILKGKTYHK